MSELPKRQLRWVVLHNYIKLALGKSKNQNDLGFPKRNHLKIQAGLLDLQIYYEYLSQHEFSADNELYWCT